MDYSTLDALKRTHPAWRLLAADHAPMIVGFLHSAFVAPNVRSAPQHALASALDDYLEQLRAVWGEAAYPRGGIDYLEVGMIFQKRGVSIAETAHSPRSRRPRRGRAHPRSKP